MNIEKDLVVVGGGVAGICAAVAAARCGIKVALVHNRPVLGGNASSEVGVGINGAATIDYSPSVYAREGGIVNELKDHIQKHTYNFSSFGLLDMVYLDFVYKEKNIELFLNTHITTVQMDGNKIKSATALQLNAENEFEFVAPIFIDCSGDGVVGCYANAEFMMGRESKYEFNESLAPEEKDDYLQGSTILWQSRDAGKKIDYTPPSFAHKIEDMSFVKNLGRIDLHRDMSNKGLSSLWWMEYGGQCDTIHQSEEITMELRKLVYGFWDYVKNSGKIEGTENYMLTNVSPIAGKRESRRFIGDYVFNQNDIFEKTDFYDRVCTGGWVIDCHAPKGIYDDDKASNWVPNRGVYNIPYRSLYSKNIENLLFGGRIISTTHIAHGSTRVMATGAVAAQASGVAAYLCSKYHITPREVLKNIEELQDILQSQDQYIMGKYEKSKVNLLNCSIKATNTSKYENIFQNHFLSLEKNYYLALPSTENQIDSVSILVKNKQSNQSTLSYRIYTGKYIECYLPTILLGEKTVKLEPNFCGYIHLDIDAKKLPDKKVYIEFVENSDIEIGYSECELTGVVTFAKSDDPTSGICIDGVGMKIQHTKNICFKDVFPNQDIFKVENLLNGYNRPYGVPNLWLSDKKEDSVITIHYEEANYIEEIQLVFNDNLKMDSPIFPVATTIKDYNLYVDDEKVEVRGNYNRVGKHQIKKYTKELKIELLDNYGHPKFEIFGIRLK